MAGDVILTVSGLSKTYGSVRALADVHLTVRRGEILGLIGPNGAGKTTLFECLAGIQAADAGVVTPSTRRSDMLFYMPDGISPWADQPVHWVLQYALGSVPGPARPLRRYCESPRTDFPAPNEHRGTFERSAEAGSAGDRAADTTTGAFDRRTVRRSRSPANPRSRRHVAVPRIAWPHALLVHSSNLRLRKDLRSLCTAQ